MRCALIALCLLAISITSTSQTKTVLVYALGDAGTHTPYCELFSNGVRLGTVKLGEYTTLEINTNQSSILEINRGGLTTIRLVLNRDSKPQFVEVLLNSRGLEAQIEASPPQEIVNLLPSNSEAVIPDAIAQKMIHTGAAWPTSGSIIELRFEPSGEISHSDILEGLIMSTLSKSYTVVNRENLDGILEEQRMALSGITSDKTPIQAGELLSSAWTIVVGYSGMSNITSRFTAINNETGQQTIPLMTTEIPRGYFHQALQESLTQE